MRFYIELANEHREFISGKKNGKISKIVKTANVKIKLEPPKEYTFVLELSGAIPVRAPGQQNGAKATGVFAGLQLLLDEMPAELSFHVPESHHKRIIGVQGKTIQAIMKDLGVYVKFSSADEHAMLGGYDDNEDNVIARTPRKNTANLERLKKAIMDLVLVKVCQLFAELTRRTGTTSKWLSTYLRATIASCTATSRSSSATLRERPGRRFVSRLVKPASMRLSSMGRRGSSTLSGP
jgi:hypothetical protein